MPLLARSPPAVGLLSVVEVSKLNSTPGSVPSEPAAPSLPEGENVHTMLVRSAGIAPLIGDTASLR